MFVVAVFVVAVFVVAMFVVAVVVVAVFCCGGAAQLLQLQQLLEETQQASALQQEARAADLATVAG